MWKVYQISSGLRVKGGFANEGAAKDWMERRGELMDEDFDVEEMDEEEEEEFLENGDEEENTDLLGDTPFAAIREFSDEDADDGEQRARTGTTFNEEEELEDGGFTVGDDDDL